MFIFALFAAATAVDCETGYISASNSCVAKSTFYTEWNLNTVSPYVYVLTSDIAYNAQSVGDMQGYVAAGMVERVGDVFDYMVILPHGYADTGAFSHGVPSAAESTRMDWLGNLNLEHYSDGGPWLHEFGHRWMTRFYYYNPDQVTLPGWAEGNVWSSHWGFSAFDRMGQLGGWAMETVYCVDPAEHHPTPEAPCNTNQIYFFNGLNELDHTVQSHDGQGGFAKFELYIMGLLSKADLGDEKWFFCQTQEKPELTDSDFEMLYGELPWRQGSDLYQTQGWELPDGATVDVRFSVTCDNILWFTSDDIDTFIEEMEKDGIQEPVDPGYQFQQAVVVLMNSAANAPTDLAGFSSFEHLQEAHDYMSTWDASVFGPAVENRASMKTSTNPDGGKDLNAMPACDTSTACSGDQQYCAFSLGDAGWCTACDGCPSSLNSNGRNACEGKCEACDPTYSGPCENTAKLGETDTGCESITADECSETLTGFYYGIAVANVQECIDYMVNSKGLVQDQDFFNPYLTTWMTPTYCMAYAAPAPILKSTLCRQACGTCECTAVSPVTDPTPNPSPNPTAQPSPNPSANPSPDPSASPSANPTPDPTVKPGDPTANPTPSPTRDPNASPTAEPTASPTTANDALGTGDDGSSNKTWIWIVIACASVVFLLAAVLVYRIACKKKAQPPGETTKGAEMTALPVPRESMGGPKHSSSLFVGTTGGSRPGPLPTVGNWDSAQGESSLI